MSTDAVPGAAAPGRAAIPSAAVAPGTLPPRRLIAVVGLSLALGYAVLLAGSVLRGEWLVDATGRPIVNDFVTMWSAGLTALNGTPTLAWDWPAAKALAVGTLGGPFPDGYPIFYPPHFLLLAMPFAMLPWLPAMLAWVAVTAPLYVFTVRAILGGWTGVLFAVGFPAALWNLTAAQNGFLNAALLGGALVVLPRRPVAAGVLLGLLTYKPHLGLLVPLALLAGGHWRTIAAAAATTLALAAAAWLAFGTAAFVAFVEAMPGARETFLVLGLGNWWKLQTVFGLVRAFGGGEALGWTLHGIVALASAGCVVLLWRSRAPHALKAAALVTGALLVTPYGYIYDMTLLAVPAAFLLRLGLDEGFLPDEPLGFVVAGGFLLAYPFCPVQLGLAATLTIALMIARRAAPFLAGVTPAAAPRPAPGRAPAG